MTQKFDIKDLKNLYTPPPNSSGEENGQITIIGGSELFHGAPLLSLTVASRIVDMVFFTSPHQPLKYISDLVKSKLFSFIWVPWNDVEEYIEKSDAVLIGPGMMRFRRETLHVTGDTSKPNSSRVTSHVSRMTFDSTGRKTRRIVERLLHEYAHKKWVIDAGALQTMDAEWIPKGSIITPNKKEFEILFDLRFTTELQASLRNYDLRMENVQKIVQEKAKEHECVIVLKGPTTIVSDGRETVLVEGGNAGLTKGGTGDVLAGLTAALLAKNSPLLAATSASFIIKKAADTLFKEVGTNYNADDVAKKIPEVLFRLTK